MPPKASTSAAPPSDTETVRNATRKAATRPAVANALAVPWPTMPQHARTQTLTAAVSLLDGISDFRQAQRKKRSRDATSSTAPSHNKSKKRKVIHTDNPQDLPPAVPQTFHSVHLRSGKAVQVPDHRLTHTLPPASFAKHPTREPLHDSDNAALNVPSEPPVLSHLVVGVNAVQTALELFIQAARASTSSSPLPEKNLSQPAGASATKRKARPDSSSSSKTSTPFYQRPESTNVQQDPSFSFLQAMYGRPALLRAEKNHVSVGKPLPSLDLPGLFGGHLTQTLGGSRSFKRSIKNSQGLNVAPQLMEATLAVIEHADKDAAAYVRKCRLQAQRIRSKEERRRKRSARRKSKFLLKKKMSARRLAASSLSQSKPQPQPQGQPQPRTSAGGQPPRRPALAVFSRQKNSSTASAASATLETRPTSSTAAAQLNLDDPLAVVLVCRADINPRDLLDHLPNTVAAANGLLVAQEGKRPVQLVQLNQGAEHALSQALAIKSAAVVGLRTSALQACPDKMNTLMNIIEHHQPQPLRSPHLDGSGDISLLDSRATAIRILRTQVPVDPRGLRSARLRLKKRAKEEKHRKRAEKTNEDIRKRREARAKEQKEQKEDAARQDGQPSAHQ